MGQMQKNSRCLLSKQEEIETAKNPYHAPVPFKDIFYAKISAIDKA
jgi:hypothetical protein